MHNVNSIRSLSEIAVKPSSWSVLQDLDNTYRLFFRYVEDDKYCPVVTARGDDKRYKTMTALMADLAKVDVMPHIYFSLNEVKK